VYGAIDQPNSRGNGHRGVTDGKVDGEALPHENSARACAWIGNSGT
jgi:hypothetical protein